MERKSMIRLRRFVKLTAAFVMLFSVAHAVTAQTLLPPCSPTVDEPTNGADQRAKAEAWAIKVCHATNGVYAQWKPKLASLDQAQQDLTRETNAADWKAYRTTWLGVVPQLKQLQQATQANPTAPGASNLSYAFGEGLGFTFKNAGLTSPGSLDDASEKILKALDGPSASAAATAGVSLVQSSTVRTADFVKGLGVVAGEQVNQAHGAESHAEVAKINEELSGSTASSYFSGIGRRIEGALGVWLFWFVVFCFGGAIVAARQGSDKNSRGAVFWAIGLAYMVPSFCMVLALIFLPFIPGWVIWLGMVIGTYVAFHNGRRVFGWAAAMAGSTTPTARRLNALGETLENFRSQLGGRNSSVQGGHAATELAADKATHGSARWGSTSEMVAGGHLQLRANPPAQAGLALARVPNATADVEPRFRYTGHVVTVASNGSGKGIGQVIPNLLEYPGSVLVLDVKGENAAITARRRRELGQKVFVVDPFGVNGQQTASFNVLDRIDVTDPDCVGESAALAESLVIQEKAGETNHFDETAKNLLQGLMLYVAGLDDPNRRNLPEVRRLLTGPEDEFLETLADMAAGRDEEAFGIPARAANTLLGTADRERGSILSTARKNTSFLDDPRIAAALSRSDFDLANIKSEPMTVYLVLPANKIGPNARFVRCFIGSVIAAITSSAKQPPHRVAFVLDEFAQLGYMKSIEDAVSLMRGYGLAFWVFLQDLSQLKGVYPRWQTFMANSAKTFYGTDDYDTAKYISDSLGQATIEYATSNQGQSGGRGISGGGGSLNSGKSSGSSQQYAGRALLTPDEVMHQGTEKAIVLVKGEYPYLLTRLNYLTDPEYAGMADPNPYHGG